MGNRPINRKPFRRPPWRTKGKAGERGWLSGMTSGMDWNQMPVRGSATPWDPLLVVQIDLVDAAEMVDHEDNMKVVRTIGEIQIIADGTQPDDVVIRAGILEVPGRIDLTSSSETIDYVSPSELNDQDRSWLWLGTGLAPNRIVGGTNPSIQYLGHCRFEVDTKSSRRLKDNDRLCLFIEARYLFRPSDTFIAESGTWFNVNLRHFCTF